MDKPPVLYGVFQQIGITVERKQHQCADYLNHKTRHLTGTRLLIALLIFCIAFGGGAGYVIWRAMHTSARTVTVKMITVPHPALPKQPDERIAPVLATTEIKHIQSFVHYLDSLQGTPSGKRLYDSIKLYRPGLLDSLALIQQIYHEQLKTK